MSVKALREEFDKMTRDYKTRLLAALKDELANLFINYPEVKTVAWSQYTPYFNDGDVCEFSVRCDEWALKINDLCRDYDEKTDLIPNHEAIAKDFAALINGAGDEVLEAAFGDHTEVTAHSNGKFTTEDYEHD